MAKVKDSTVGLLEDVRAQRSEALKQTEHDVKRAEEISNLLAGYRRDKGRHERHRDNFARFGAERIEVPNPYRPGPALGLPDFELEPFRSKRTGNELASDIQARIDVLRGMISGLEAEADELRGGASS